MTWAELAGKWLREHPGWHETREISDALQYHNPRNFSCILQQVKGIAQVWGGPLQQSLWCLVSEFEQQP